MCSQLGRQEWLRREARGKMADLGGRRRGGEGRREG